MGIGFAVPVDTVRRLVPQLIENGEPVRPGIGVQLVSDYVARRNNVRGLIVRSVVRGGPAARAGIEGLRRTRRGDVSGDVIVGVNGEPVESLDDLVLAFEAQGVGARVRLTVRRDRRERHIAEQSPGLEPGAPEIGRGPGERSVVHEHAFAARDGRVAADDERRRPDPIAGATTASTGPPTAVAMTSASATASTTASSSVARIALSISMLRRSSPATISYPPLSLRRSITPGSTSMKLSR